MKKWFIRYLHCAYCGRVVAWRFRWSWNYHRLDEDACPCNLVMREPDMPRFAISMYCSRVEQYGNPDRLIPGSLSIVHNPGMVEAVSIAEAAGIGIEIIRKLFPSKDGWQNHDVKVCRDDNILTVEGAHVRENQR